MAIEKSVLAGVISEHWNSLKRQHIDVPELQVEGEAVRIWFDPISLDQRDKLAKFTKRGESVAELLIMKAVDESGEKLFSLADKMMLMNQTASWVEYVADRIDAAGAIPVDLLGKP